MPRHCASIPALAFALILNITGVAAAQTDRGTITGSVMDSSGGAVAKASVKAIHVATNFERTATTSEQGTYTIPANRCVAVPAGAASDTSSIHGTLHDATGRPWPPGPA